MPTGIDQIFGNAISIATANVSQVYPYLLKQICEVMANGFGLGTTIGDQLFYSISNYPNLKQTNGVDKSSLYYNEIQVNYRNLFQSLYPQLNSFQVDIYALVTNAIIFGWSLSTNISAKSIISLLNSTIVQANSITQTNPFSYYPYPANTIISPFTVDFIQNAVNNYGYDIVYSQIQTSVKNQDIKIVNVNWYETTGLFAAPNLQLMKDCENQYYYVSGELIYNIPQENPCVYSYINVNTPTGNKIIKYINNIPCYDQDSYIGPINNTKFYRIFNDGPYSSGDFNDTIKNEFIQLDENVLTPNDYQSNSKILYSFYSTGQYVPLVDYGEIFTFIDANGEVDINREYLYSPQSSGINDYQIMRVGGNNIREQITGYDEEMNPLYGKIPATGFKFANISLKTQNWLTSLSNILTNPISNIDRISNRSLNIQDNPYIGTEGNGTLSAYTLDINNNQIWYVGPPQINGGNILPYFAFYQDFDNKTFGKNAKVTIYPALGQANGDTNDNNRTWSISKNPITSGIDNTHYSYNTTDGIPTAKFNTILSSNLSSGDSIFASVFGMGDSFGGQYNISATYEQNAGFYYTGYLYQKNGLIYSFSTGDIFNSYSQYLLGSKNKNMVCISGYTGHDTLQISQMFCQDNTGKLYNYYYFDNRLNPVQTQQTGWAYFSPTPIEIDNSDEYGRVYENFAVENYFPRFSNGPYAIVEEKILYPNALNAANLYNSRLNGFPKNIKFTLKVREETLKEIYCKYLISNGTIGTAQNVSVIRPYTFGYNLGALQNIFDGPLNNILYDFNMWATNYQFTSNSGTTLVDNAWGPVLTVDNVINYPYSTNIYYSGRNGLTYNASNPSFVQGILLTGIGDFYTLVYTGVSGQSEYIFQRANPAYGLYHNYTGYSMTGMISYVKPIFDLKNLNLNPNYSSNTLPIMFENAQQIEYEDINVGGMNNCAVYYFNGNTTIASSGKEPIYYEFIGGRKGSSLATLQGGYHNENIIGDGWMFLNYEQIGSFFNFACPPLITYTPTRYPNNDNQLILLFSNPNQTTISTRALNYNPFAFNYNDAPPFVSGQNINPSINIKTIFEPRYNGIGFDLYDIFPLKFNNQIKFYNPSGINIGPFNNDVELYILDNPIYVFSQLVVNNQALNDYSYCENDPCYYNKDNRFLNQGIGSVNKDPIMVIPSGTLININVKANFSCDLSDPYATGIGVFSGTRIYVRNRKTLKECNISTHLNDSSSSYNFNYDKNGMEHQFIINHTGGFENIQGNSHTFITYSRTGILYPQPDPNILTGMGKADKLGNLIFPSVEQYWKNLSLKSGIITYASGWREGARISFTFENIEIEYDDIPYQTYNQIIPTGICIISGVMAYNSQAEASIFSQGFILKDNSNNLSLITGMYAPSYVSDVLSRLTGLFPSLVPNESFTQPILSAPSMMEQREIIPIITDNQLYTKLNNSDPYNYNKFCWLSSSDLFTLNNEETIEVSSVPDDGNTYENNTILLSAAQGQTYADGTKSIDGSKIYDVINIFQFYDSLSTDSLTNSGYFLTQNMGIQNRMTQKKDCTGFLVPINTSITRIKQGLV